MHENHEYQSSDTTNITSITNSTDEKSDFLPETADAYHEYQKHIKGGDTHESIDNQSSDATNITSLTSSTDKKSEADYLTALEQEFKRLKKLHSADRMSYYYNSYRKQWELFKGNEVILKLPIANGLTVEECLQRLRTAFKDATTSKDFDPLFDF